MEKISGQYGDVFRHKGDNYVYLVQVNEIIYAALIVNEQIANRINTLYEKETKKGGIAAKRALDSRIYRLVILTTEQFKKHGAYLYQPQHSANEISLNIIGKINTDDMIALKKEIETGAYQDELKETTKKISLS